MAQDIQLINPQVNGGVAVTFQGATLNYVWKSLTRATPLTNKFDINEAQISGFENPRITVTGFIDTNDNSANVVTQSLLQDFASNKYDGDTNATTGTATRLSVSTGTSNTYLKNYDNSADDVIVIVDSFNMTVDASDSDLGHFWRYTLTLIETK